MTIDEARAAIGAQLQQQAINALTENLARALIEVEELKAKLLAAHGENKTLLESQIKCQKSLLDIQVKADTALNAKAAAQVDRLPARVANSS